MRGCFLDAGSVGTNLDWSSLENALDDWQWHHNTDASRVAERIAGADVVVTNKVVLDGPTLRASESLKLICVAATGVNNIDLGAASGRGIPVVNVTGYATPSVSQHVLALMLAFATRWADYDAAVKRGAWAASEFFCLLDHPIEELSGQTLGLVGHGELGAAVARLAEAFGMTVLISERPGVDSLRDGRVAFDDMLGRADVISLHCPLTEATRHLIDGQALARMKPGAFLINTARGGLIDADALRQALIEGAIGGAALDVLDTEPPRGGHTLIDASIPNLIVTPHSAWGSRGARQRVLDGVSANIRDFLNGDTGRRVN